MENLKSSIQLEKIDWPVFLLKKEKPVIYNKITGYLKHSLVIDNNEINSEFLVIDDKNIEGDSLGSRRLKLLHNNVKLFKLRKAIYMIGDLVRLTSGKKSWAIDNSGTVFNYIKTVRAPLTCHKIVKILRVPTGGLILELEGLSERFKILNSLQNCKYAGILRFNKTMILYGLYETPFKSTYRMI